MDISQLPTYDSFFCESDDDFIWDISANSWKKNEASDKERHGDSEPSYFLQSPVSQRITAENSKHGNRLQDFKRKKLLEKEPFNYFLKTPVSPRITAEDRRHGNILQNCKKPTQQGTEKRASSDATNCCSSSLSSPSLQVHPRHFEEDDDEFWYFLKSSDDGHRAFTNAELEEIKSLSTITPLRDSELDVPNSATALTEGNPQQSASTTEDIYRDLDLLMTEIEATLGEISTPNDECNSKDWKNDSATDTFSSKNASRDTLQAKMIPKTLPESVRPSILRGQSDQRHSLKQVGNTDPCVKADSDPSRKNEVAKKIIPRQNNMPDSASSGIMCNFQNQMKSADGEVNAILALKTSELIGTASKSMLQEKISSINDFPVITSCFSLSTSSNALEGQKSSISTNKPSSNTTVKNSKPDVAHHDSNLPQTKPSQSLDLNSRTEPNTCCSTTVCPSIYAPSQKQKNIKRLLPQSSTRNLLFWNSDSGNTCEFQCNPETKIFNNSTNNKRLKTSDTTDSFMHQSLLPVQENNKKCSSNVQINNKTIPTLIVSTNTGTLATNPAPLYYIIPKLAEPGQNSNAELVMVINNNSNLIANNSEPKGSSGLINSTLPISSVMSVTSDPVSNSNNIMAGKTIPEIPVSALNIVNLPQSLGTSNYLQQTIANNPPCQSIANKTGKQYRRISSSTSKINIIPTSLSKDRVQTNDMNVFAIPGHLNAIGPPTSQANASTISVLPHNFQFHSMNSEVNRQPLSGILGLSGVNLFQPGVNLLQSIPVDPVLAKTTSSPREEVRQQKFKPLKNIQLGKDKYAIQQISIPLKMENVIDSKFPRVDNYDNLIAIPTSNGSTELKVQTTHLTSEVSSQVPRILQKLPAVTQQRNKVFNFVPCKPKTETVLVKRDIITNETALVNKNQFLSSQPTTSSKLINVSSASEMQTRAASLIQDKTIQSSMNPTCVSLPATFITNNSDNASSNSILKAKTDALLSKSQNQETETQKNALATLQELFPPPISMIPVCVMPTEQTNNKSSKVLVLPAPSVSTGESELSTNKGQKKIVVKRPPIIKPKKKAPKTVKQLLEEGHKRWTSEAIKCHPQAEIINLKPIYNLDGNDVLVSTNVPASMKSTTTVENSKKRPNIMILPSATKCAQSNDLPGNSVKKEVHGTFQSTSNTNTSVLEITQDFLFDKMMTSKEYRPRYYDMCELRIGYFKVEDDVEPCGRFRSKFKVLFRKSMFVYDFPVSKCNQVDISTSYSWEQMACVQVPFKTVVALNMNNRHVNIQVNKCPQVLLKRPQERTDLTSDGRHCTAGHVKDSLWIDVVRNSFKHKIILRKRQADTLKMHLCQIDPRFLILFRIGHGVGNSSLNASPFEEELASVNLSKTFPKSKRTMIRRLPQWDSDDVINFNKFMVADPLISSNHACSCRISCKSMRCSCAKAAKSCSSGGTVCFCTDCDNPLSMLESFGLDLDFSLRDRCLFQNIYQIRKLRDYLERDVKLTCCNTVARVMDCVPGTTLCPNAECNARVEFSWCRGVVTYPERNPRNHCSHCGLCCFSNGRHCPVCNRCYVVSSKCPDCPNCRENGFSMEHVGGNGDFPSGPFVERLLPRAPSSKPEIILLDRSAAESDTTSKNERATEDAKVDSPEISAKSDDPKRAGEEKDLAEEIEATSGKSVEKHPEDVDIKGERCSRDGEDSSLDDHVRKLLDFLREELTSNGCGDRLEMKLGEDSATDHPEIKLEEDSMSFWKI